MIYDHITTQTHFILF